MNKENTIILEEEQNGFFFLMLENEKEKKEALNIIQNGGVVSFGYSEDITKEEFEEYKKQGYTIVKLK